MRSAYRQKTRANPIDLGILVGVALLLFVFEAIPSMTVGRLSVKTEENEMIGFDPGILYDIPPELPDDPIDVEDILNQVVPVDINPIELISMTDDTTGLRIVGTVENPDGHININPDDQGIPLPGTFIAHSVAPTCNFRPLPDYPEMARMAGVEGRVILQVFVGVDGVPVDVVLIQSSEVSPMDDSAMVAAWNSRWSAARRADGTPVGVWTSVVYDFVLN